MPIIDQDNLYDPEKQSINSETKTLAYLIFQAIRTNQVDQHTSFPARVTEVTKAGCYVSIIPQLKRRFMDGAVVDLPIIQNVPVVHPRGAGYYTRFPIKKNDTGLAIISQRSLDVWKVSGGEVDPKDMRLHDLSDAMFIPGAYPMSDPVPLDGGDDSLAFLNDKSLLALQAGGKFLAKNLTTGAELFDLVSQLIYLVQDMATNVAAGTVATYGGLSTAGLISQNATDAGAIKLSFDTLKGA